MVKWFETLLFHFVICNKSDKIYYLLDNKEQLPGLVLPVPSHIWPVNLFSRRQL